VPFLACGDLNGYDADCTYALETSFQAPNQMPIDPPYKTALGMRFVFFIWNFVDFQTKQ
jgi:tRNA (cytidine32/guanosine34-2'-O)-methyltransferase